MSSLRNIAIFVAFCGIVTVSNGRSERNKATDCNLEKFQKNLVRLCASRKDRRRGLPENSEEEIDKLKELQEIDDYKRRGRRQELPEEVDMVAVDLGDKKETNLFVESLQVWYLNPVRMGSAEAEKPLSRDRGDAKIELDPGFEVLNLTSWGKFGRDPRASSRLLEFHRKKCCHIGCAYPDDYNEVIGDACH